MAAIELVLGRMPCGASPKSHWAAGAWCFSGQEKLFPDWDKDFKFAPEPLIAHPVAAVAARAAQTLAVREMPAVARLLCRDADQFPQVYWQVLLAPFMIEVASQIVERALRARAMVEQWGDEPLRVELLPENCQFAFADEHDFTLRGSLGLQFNHWLLSRLLEGSMPARWQAHYSEAYEQPPPPRENLGVAGRIRAVLRKWLDGLPFPLFKGMGIKDALEFSWHLRKAYSGNFRAMDLNRDFVFAEDLSRIPLPENVGRIFARALPHSLKSLRHTPVRRHVGTPRLRVAPIAAGECAPLRQRLARWRAAGNALAHCQHGGVYGHAATPCAASVVEYSQNIFFTWGWRSQGDAQGNFLPAPSPLLSALPAYEGGSGQLIMVGTEMSAYGRRLDSHPTPLQFAAYRRAKKTFLEALPAEIRGRVSYRPYFPLLGTLADAEWLLPQFPEIKLCEGALSPKLLRCKLLVVDHPGTTLLEALAAGVPVVAYWDRMAWPWCPEAEAFLEKLAGCGIWQESPQAAAAHVGRTWTDPLSWWDSREARQARDEFTHEYARSGHFHEIWTDMLGKL